LIWQGWGSKYTHATHPLNCSRWWVGLSFDQGTEYVTQAPAAFKEHINAIQAIEDPYEQSKAAGELMGKVLPAYAAAGGARLVKWPASWAGGGR